MSLVRDATVTPTKVELMDGWLPGRTWFRGESGVAKVASYRFDATGRGRVGGDSGAQR